MINPSKVFLSWFDTVKPALQREIAFNVLSRTPDREGPVDFDDPKLIDGFTTWIQGHNTLGRISIVRDVVDSLELWMDKDSYEAVRNAHMSVEALNRWQGFVASEAKREMLKKVGVTNN